MGSLLFGISCRFQNSLIMPTNKQLSRGDHLQLEANSALMRLFNKMGLAPERVVFSSEVIKVLSTSYSFCKLVVMLMLSDGIDQSSWTGAIKSVVDYS